MAGIDIKAFSKRSPKSVKRKSALEQLSSLLDKEIQLFPIRFTAKHKESFYLELSTLLSAGLDIRSALELIEGEQTNTTHKGIIQKLKDDLVNGAPLWDAMKQSGYFTPYEYYTVQIGEETGKLDLVLDQLNKYFASVLKQRQQFISALSYPVIILFTSIGAVAFMMLFMVPMFKDVFTRFGGDLPYLTKMIIAISETVKRYVLLVILLTIVISFYLYHVRDSLKFRKVSAMIVGRIPVIGRIVYALQMARFCTSLSLLLGSKVPLVRSFGLIQQMITFYPIQVTLDLIAENIMNGVSLHLSMQKFDIYNRKMISLIKVGEEVNKLDIFFEKLASQYKNEVDHQTSLLNTFLEPAMIIFLGFVVGIILLAMYLPMFQLSTSIGN